MAKFGLSQSLRRVEDPRLLLGHGRYTDDIALPGAARGHVLRSPHAHARIVSLDATAARAMPGAANGAAPSSRRRVSTCLPPFRLSGCGAGDARMGQAKPAMAKPWSVDAGAPAGPAKGPLSAFASSSP